MAGPTGQAEAPRPAQEPVQNPAQEQLRNEAGGQDSAAGFISDGVPEQKAPVSEISAPNAIKPILIRVAVEYRRRSDFIACFILVAGGGAWNISRTLKIQHYGFLFH